MDINPIISATAASSLLISPISAQAAFLQSLLSRFTGNNGNSLLQNLALQTFQSNNNNQNNNIQNNNNPLALEPTTPNFFSSLQNNQNAGGFSQFNSNQNQQTENAMSWNSGPSNNLGFISNNRPNPSNFGSAAIMTTTQAPPTTIENNLDPRAQELASCEVAVEQMMMRHVKFSLLPTCNRDGSWSARQTNQLGIPYCADRYTGAPIPGTEGNLRGVRLSCEEIVSMCQTSQTGYNRNFVKCVSAQTCTKCSEMTSNGRCSKSNRYGKCQPGCKCPSGQLFDETTNSCVDIADCPNIGSFAPNRTPNNLQQNSRTTKPLTKCQQQNANRRNAHAATCDPVTGLFTKIQCIDKATENQACFCVNVNTGQKLSGYKFHENALGDCSIPKYGTCAYQKFITDVVRNQRTKNRVEPRCDLDGLYSWTQIDAKGTFYCVSDRKTGKRKFGTEHRKDQGYVCMDGGFLAKAQVRACEIARDQIYDQGGISQLNSVFIPYCHPVTGLYLPKQCDTETNICWCVQSTQTGLPMEQTKSSADTFDQDCLEVARLGRLQTRCERERSKATQGGALGAMSQLSGSSKYVPQCDDRGMFVPKQCDESNGDCWCIQNIAMGDRILDTMTPAEVDFTFNCAKIVDLGRMPSTCEKQREDVARQVQSQSNRYSYLRQEIFMPKCLENGDYIAKQCTKSVCFCLANAKTGGIVEETRGPANKNFAFDCVKIMSMGRMPTKCETQREEALKQQSSQVSTRSQGLFIRNRNQQTMVTMIPQCDTQSGNFLAKQCPPGTGFCFCVENLQTGVQLAATMTKDETGTFIWDCDYIAMKGRLQTKCELEASRSELLNVDYRPLCNSRDGTYEPKQCDSIGCWCVSDPEDGTRIYETRSRDKINFPHDCEMIKRLGRMPTKCEAEKKRATDNFENFIPDCNLKTGQYLAKQCDAVDNVCWCVSDLDLGTQVLETVAPVLIHDCNIIAQAGRVLTPCEIERYQANQKNSLTAGQTDRMGRPVRAAGFIPVCDAQSGNYVSQQCNDNTGYCWCVESLIYGGRVKETEMRPMGRFGKKTFDYNCDEISTMGRLETLCEKEQKRAVSAQNGLQMVGVFLPVCDLETGLYSPKQCHASTGYCWCVKSQETGDKVPETMVAEMRGDPFIWDCDKIIAEGFRGQQIIQPIEEIMEEQLDTECFRMKKEALRLQKEDPSIVPPACTRDGKFEPVQIFFGEAICVDPVDGNWLEEAQATITGGWSCESVLPEYYEPTAQPTTSGGLYQEYLVTPAVLTECQKAAQRAEKLVSQGAVDLYPPKCDPETGNYENLQYLPSRGYYCVDSQTGMYVSSALKIEGADGAEEYSCSRLQSHCEKTRETALIMKNQGMPDLPIPKCTSAGLYETIQHYGGTLGVVCVDPLTGVMQSNAVKEVDGADYKCIILTQCQKDAQDAQRLRDNLGTADPSSNQIFVPECDPESGNYLRIQNNNIDGYYCVDEITGEFDVEAYFVEGTEIVKCRDEEEIKILCPQNEEYHTCGNRCLVEKTCESYGERPVEICTKECQAGCFCKEGTFRKKIAGGNEICVPIEECPEKPIDIGPEFPKLTNCEQESARMKALIAENNANFEAGRPYITDLFAPECDPITKKFNRVQYGMIVSCVDIETGEFIKEAWYDDETARCDEQPVIEILVEPEATAPSIVLPEDDGAYIEELVEDSIEIPSEIGPCTAANERVQIMNAEMSLDIKPPSCDDNGNFLPVQLSADGVTANCVDIYTGDFSGQQAVSDGFGQFTCKNVETTTIEITTTMAVTQAPPTEAFETTGIEQEQEKTEESVQCLRAYQNAQKMIATGLVPDLTLPQCDEAGNFNQIQQNSVSTICVNIFSGDYLEDAEIDLSTGEYFCPGSKEEQEFGQTLKSEIETFEKESEPKPETACEKARNQVLALLNSSMAIEMSPPICDDFGNFAQIQENESGPYCVDATSGAWVSDVTYDELGRPLCSVKEMEENKSAQENFQNLLNDVTSGEEAGDSGEKLNELLRTMTSDSVEDQNQIISEPAIGNENSCIKIQNSEFSPCRNRCSTELSCTEYANNVNLSEKMCTRECTEGCFCQPGFYRYAVEDGFECVSAESCQNLLGLNVGDRLIPTEPPIYESYDEIIPPGIPPEELLTEKLPEIVEVPFPDRTPPGMLCDQISQKKIFGCTNRCSQELTCQDLKEGKSLEFKVCTRECDTESNGCYCKEGFYRDSEVSDSCVPAEKCPNMQLIEAPLLPPRTPPAFQCPNSENETYNPNCVNRCTEELTCQEFLAGEELGQKVCTRECATNKCFCNAGFYRDEKSDKCVEPGTCIINSSEFVMNQQPMESEPFNLTAVEVDPIDPEAGRMASSGLESEVMGRPVISEEGQNFLPNPFDSQEGDVPMGRPLLTENGLENLNPMVSGFGPEIGDLRMGSNYTDNDDVPLGRPLLQDPNSMPEDEINFWMACEQEWDNLKMTYLTLTDQEIFETYYSCKDKVNSETKLCEEKFCQLFPDNSQNQFLTDEEITVQVGELCASLLDSKYPEGVPQDACSVDSEINQDEINYWMACEQEWDDLKINYPNLSDQLIFENLYSCRDKVNSETKLCEDKFCQIFPNNTQNQFLSDEEITAKVGELCASLLDSKYPAGVPENACSVNDESDNNDQTYDETFWIQCGEKWDQLKAQNMTDEQAWPFYGTECQEATITETENCENLWCEKIHNTGMLEEQQGLVLGDLCSALLKGKYPDGAPEDACPAGDPFGYKLVEEDQGIYEEPVAPATNLTDPFGYKLVEQDQGIYEQPNSANLTDPFGYKLVEQDQEIYEEPATNSTDPFGYKLVEQDQGIYEEPAANLTDPFGYKLVEQDQGIYEEPVGNLTDPNGYKLVEQDSEIYEAPVSVTTTTTQKPEPPIMIERPPMPFNLRKLDATDTSITVRFRKPEGDLSVFTHYQVDYLIFDDFESFLSKESRRLFTTVDFSREEVYTYPNPKGLKLVNIEIPNLAPGRVYEILVRSFIFHPQTNDKILSNIFSANNRLVARTRPESPTEIKINRVGGHTPTHVEIEVDMSGVPSYANSKYNHIFFKYVKFDPVTQKNIGVPSKEERLDKNSERIVTEVRGLEWNTTYKFLAYTVSSYVDKNGVDVTRSVSTFVEYELPEKEEYFAGHGGENNPFYGLHHGHHEEEKVADEEEIVSMGEPGPEGEPEPEFADYQPDPFGFKLVEEDAGIYQPSNETKPEGEPEPEIADYQPDPFGFKLVEEDAGIYEEPMETAQPDPFGFKLVEEDAGIYEEPAGEPEPESEQEPVPEQDAAILKPQNQYPADPENQPAIEDEDWYEANYGNDTQPDPFGFKLVEEDAGIYEKPEGDLGYDIVAYEPETETAAEPEQKPVPEKPKIATVNDHLKENYNHTFKLSLSDPRAYPCIEETEFTFAEVECSAKTIEPAAGFEKMRECYCWLKPHMKEKFMAEKEAEAGQIVTDNDGSKLELESKSESENEIENETEPIEPVEILEVEGVPIVEESEIVIPGQGFEQGTEPFYNYDLSDSQYQLSDYDKEIYNN